MKPHLEKLLREILLENKNPVCLHTLGQSLVDSLCEIIREQATAIENWQRFHDKIQEDIE